MNSENVIHCISFSFLPRTSIFANSMARSGRMASADLGGDGPVLVYYNYHSVPIPQERIDYLIKHVVSQLGCDFDRMYFCCDVRATSKDVVDHAQSLEHCEIMHMSLSNGGSLDELLCERMRWHAATCDGGHGMVALISDSGNFGATLTALSRGGWRVAIFHPPKTDNTFLDYADEAYALPIHREIPESDYPVDRLGGTPIGPTDCRITTMAQDVRQGLTHLLSRLSGAMGGTPGAGVLPLSTSNPPEDPQTVMFRESIGKATAQEKLLGDGDAAIGGSAHLAPPTSVIMTSSLVASSHMNSVYATQVTPMVAVYSNSTPALPVLCTRCRCETSPDANPLNGSAIVLSPGARQMTSHQPQQHHDEYDQHAKGEIGVGGDRMTMTSSDRLTMTPSFAGAVGDEKKNPFGGQANPFQAKSQQSGPKDTWDEHCAEMGGFAGGVRRRADENDDTDGFRRNNNMMQQQQLGGGFSNNNSFGQQNNMGGAGGFGNGVNGTAVGGGQGGFGGGFGTNGAGAGGQGGFGGGFGTNGAGAGGQGGFGGGFGANGAGAGGQGGFGNGMNGTAGVGGQGGFGGGCGSNGTGAGGQAGFGGGFGAIGAGAGGNGGLGEASGLGGGQRNPFQQGGAAGGGSGGFGTTSATLVNGLGGSPIRQIRLGENSQQPMSGAGPMLMQTPGDGRVERFRKPAAQCPLWDDRDHRANGGCSLWHPYKQCIFFPQCRSAAAECGYAHPFCSAGECECLEGEKDIQLNHLMEQQMMN